MSYFTVICRDDHCGVAMCRKQAPDFLPGKFAADSLKRIFYPSQEMIGKNRNPDMSVATVLSIVKKRSQAEFAFHQPESRFDLGQGDVNLPDAIV